ncbi:MAG: alanine--tRNA ligase [Patescibacteria group bacterium]|nr:MAG: alanine--tRNA ligase [Patescibacteria group bacterium]
MNHFELRQRFSSFWESKDHKWVPPIPLIPVNDSTTLFTSSGMQQLVPYLLGQEHPLGKRLYNIQPCFRSQDIEDIGDNRHTTFFEMMGNWSLGDYFKTEQLNWVFEFLVQELGLNPNNLYVTVFSGWQKLPEDKESILIWKKIFKQYGIQAEVGERIFKYPAEKNWWSRSGVPENMPVNEPGGPDSEIFYKFDSVEHNKKFGDYCHPNCDCGRFIEIGNSVFMQYKKTESGFVELPNKNVDFGGGLERILAACCNNPDVFLTDLYKPLINQLEVDLGFNYSNSDNKKSLRIIADHLKAAVFLIKDGVVPSNKEQGYFLRRLLRRLAVKIYQAKDEVSFEYVKKSISVIIKMYHDVYFKDNNAEDISGIVAQEFAKFGQTIKQGFKKIKDIDKISPKLAFDLYQSYGFPFEITKEIFEQRGQSLSQEEFNNYVKEHKKISRRSMFKKFKGGLADKEEQTIKYHTATHLIHQAITDLLGETVRQEGSNITAERLRFDFYSNQKPDDNFKDKLEKIVNEKIKQGLPVRYEIMPKEKAYKIGAKSFFKEKYPDKVKVYFIGEYSKEFCGGPHVANTSEIGSIKIVKIKKIGSDLYRVYAK